jgi:hypothetical protein
MSMSPETRALVEADLNDPAKPPLHRRKVADFITEPKPADVPPPQAGVNSLACAFRDENK